MKRSKVRAIGLAVLLTCGACSSNSQSPDAALAPARLGLNPGPQSAGAPEAGSVCREIRDPHTGFLWLLMRDPSRLGGPGQMVVVAVGLTAARSGARVGNLAVPPMRARPGQSLPVIHTGDRLIVEESTVLVDARLEAVALGPAISGALFNARLVLGGNVVRALALAPGRAAFASERGTRP